MGNARSSWYCWWFRIPRPTTGSDVRNAVNNGITYLLTGAGFLKSTVGRCRYVWNGLENAVCFCFTSYKFPKVYYKQPFVSSFCLFSSVLKWEIMFLSSKCCDKWGILVAKSTSCADFISVNEGSNDNNIKSWIVSHILSHLSHSLKPSKASSNTKDGPIICRSLRACERKWGTLFFVCWVNFCTNLMYFDDSYTVDVVRQLGEVVWQG